MSSAYTQNNTTKIGDWVTQEAVETVHFTECDVTCVVMLVSYLCCEGLVTQ